MSATLSGPNRRACAETMACWRPDAQPKHAQSKGLGPALAQRVASLHHVAKRGEGVMPVCAHRLMHVCAHACAHITAEEFEREKQGLLRQRQAQVLHYQQQVFNLGGLEGGVDKGVADALLAGPPWFGSGGVGGKGGGGCMIGGSNPMIGASASKQAQPVRPNRVAAQPCFLEPP